MPRARVAALTTRPPSRAEVLDLFGSDPRPLHAREIASRLNVSEVDYLGLQRLLDDLSLEGVLATRPGQRFKLSAEIPSLPVAKCQLAANQIVEGSSGSVEDRACRHRGAAAASCAHDPAVTGPPPRRVAAGWADEARGQPQPREMAGFLKVLCRNRQSQASVAAAQPIRCCGAAACLL